MKYRSFLPGLVWIAALAVLTGCARDLVVSRPLRPDTLSAGVLYYLPKTLVKVTAQRQDKDQDIKMESLPAVPDSRHGYVARFAHDALASDQFKVTITTNGLLSAIERTREDKSGEIIVKLNETAVQAARLLMTARYPAADTKMPEAHLEEIFDPADTNAVAKLNRHLEQRHFDYQIRVDAPELTAAEAAGFPNGAPGIVHRRAALCILTITKNGQDVSSEPFVLPNCGPITAIPLKGGRFVTTTYTAKFVDGVLTEMTADRPSELLGIVSILPNVLKNIASIPAEIFQLKIDYSSKQKALLDAKKDLIAAQQALLEAQKKTAPPPAGPGPATGDPITPK